jgi:hypothetical protein
MKIKNNFNLHCILFSDSILPYVLIQSTNITTSVGNYAATVHIPQNLKNRLASVLKKDFTLLETMEFNGQIYYNVIYREQDTFLMILVSF